MTVNVTPVADVAPIVRDDRVITNRPASDIDIPHFALLFNDTDANGDPISITGAGDAESGTVTYNPGTILFNDSANPPGGSFTYTGEAGGLSEPVTSR